MRPKVRYIFSAEIPEAMNEGVKFHCVYVPPLITLYMFHHHVSHTNHSVGKLLFCVKASDTGEVSLNSSQETMTNYLDSQI